MLGMKEIMREAESLSVQERILVIDFLLRTLNPPTPEIDVKWLEISKRRLGEIRSGSVKAVPGEEVLIRIRDRFER